MLIAYMLVLTIECLHWTAARLGMNLGDHVS